jgi:Putative peptidoglycan binding domain
MSHLHLELSASNDDLVEKLGEICDLKTKKDIVENALMLLGWAASEAAKGLSIAAVDEKRSVYREVQTPALQNARLTAERFAAAAQERLSEAAQERSLRAADARLKVKRLAPTDKVLQVQEALRKKGVYSGVLDGVLGGMTTVAIRAFLGRYGINVSGPIDNQILNQT